MSQTTTMLRSGGICFGIAQTIFTNWERRLAVLQICGNNCNATLGHKCFLTLQTICTNCPRWYTVKQFRVHSAVVKNVLLGDACVLTEIVTVHIREQLFHCPFHPHINRKKPQFCAYRKGVCSRQPFCRRP